ncbi:MAG: CoB--CoM heterodisulfide reductase iron-sulfur subunit A family protein [Peptococcaceae bacterium]|nr:CoB--CoM heterodisulfide reductase iron-sulfur subunit A family protein [Peptococcaceae bacterium]
MAKRIGLFICWCGSNIGGVVDVPRVVEETKNYPGVAFATDYKYMCSEPGQNLIISKVKEHNLDRVVVASCTPMLHEPTFRKAIARAGLNPYMFDMANIREQCSWVHSNDKEAATQKAIALVKRALAKVSQVEPLFESSIPITKKALVVGAGIAGIQVALDIADSGHEVILLERESTIGGNMVKLDKTFPTMDCSACISTPKMVQAAQHPNITIMTYAELVDVQGYIGNFEVTIKQKARFVDHTICTGCGLCTEKCPTKVSSSFELGMGKRKAIYIEFPQAVPNKPVIDPDNCRYLKNGKCGICKKLCPVGAVDFEQKDELIEEKVGAIVIATGYDLIKWEEIYGEYGYGRFKDVITGLQFERLVNASGPTNGLIQRPSDGKEPKTVVFIKCVGSRDEAKAKEYCSRACCMYTAKHAHQVIEKIEGGHAYIFYMDVRTPGKAYDEFYRRTVDEGAQYIRGRVSKIYQSGDKLVVMGADTLLGSAVHIEADLVVLATAMVPTEGSEKIAQLAGVNIDKDGFFIEAHPKLRPVETMTGGVFLAGACQGPKDIPDTVSQASGAAAKVAALLSNDQMATDPMICHIDEKMCSGCLVCKEVCPYKAISEKTITERIAGQPVERIVASVNTGLCQGCGNCTVACRAGAANLKGYTNLQLLSEVDALCR